MSQPRIQLIEEKLHAFECANRSWDAKCLACTLTHTESECINESRVKIIYHYIYFIPIARLYV